jgi:hypothetical protein
MWDCGNEAYRSPNNTFSPYLVIKVGEKLIKFAFNLIFPDTCVEQLAVSLFIEIDFNLCYQLIAQIAQIGGYYGSVRYIYSS